MTPPKVPLPGAILAAGRSTRMGRSKALLAVDPRAEPALSFTASIARVLHAAWLSPVFVVGRPGDEALRAHVEAAAPAIGYVENARADEGQLSSIVAAIDAVPDGAPGVLVTLVDLPLVQRSTIDSLLAAFASRPDAIVRASCGGRHGHPVIFPSCVFDDLRRADPAVGARAVLRASPESVVDCAVDDAGVLHDIDTPDDYARLIVDPS